MPVRVGVLGAAGRIGATVCRAVAADPALELVAAVDPRQAGAEVRAVTGLENASLRVARDVAELARSRAEVAVDFTEPDAARENLRWCASNGVHAVVGTTGLSGGDIDEIRASFGLSGAPNCIVAPNFAIGAVLLARLAAIAAPHMESAEVIELHHDAKLDAPSGTSLAIVAAMHEARRASGAGDWPEDPTRVESLPGTRGGAGPGRGRIHSLRLKGLVAHHEVVFGARGQSLTIRHDSYDRESFMPGVLLAVKAVPRRPGLTLGLEPVLGL